MMTIIMEADIPPYLTDGFKETLHMFCEEYGDVKIVRIDDDNDKPAEQMRMGGL